MANVIKFESLEIKGLWEYFQNYTDVRMQANSVGLESREVIFKTI